MSRKITLITGATSGLGYEFAKIYAIENNDLLLIGRNKEKLDKVAKELEQIKPGVYVDYFVCDLTNREEMKHVYDYTVYKDYFVNNLINCAGFGDCKDFIDMDIDLQLQMIDVNCSALVYYTRMFLKPMLKQDEGHIINVSSIASFYPGPYMSTYHMTKALVTNFSEAISYEIRESNVHLLNLCPGPFNSGFVGKAHNDYTFSKLKPIDASAVASIGYKQSLKGKSFYVIGFKNRLMLFASRFCSRKTITKSSANTLKEKNKQF